MCKRRKFTPKEWKILDDYTGFALQVLADSTRLIGCSTIPVRHIDEFLKLSMKIQVLRSEFGNVLFKENPSMRKEATSFWDQYQTDDHSREEILEMEEEIDLMESNPDEYHRIQNERDEQTKKYLDFVRRKKEIEKRNPSPQEYDCLLLSLVKKFIA